MFEAFPIIMLTDQFDAINHTIVKHKLSRDDVIWWLNWYGEVVRQDQEHPVRGAHYILNAMPITGDMPEVYVFASPYGYKFHFRISQRNCRILIFSPMGGFPWDRGRIFKYEEE